MSNATLCILAVNPGPKASARALAAEGSNVVINGRDEERLAAAVDDVRADAADGATVLPPAKPFLETTDEEWYDAFDLLVMSVVRTVRAAASHLRADGGGTIVTIASIIIKEPKRDLVLSNAVRSGVVGLEKTLSQEFAPEIRANAVLPGTHETPRVEEIVDQGVERGDYDSYDDEVEK